MKQRLLHIEEAIRENQRLQRLVDLKPRLARKTIGARVIGRDTSNWWRSIQIDRGEADQVTPGRPVVTDRGLVGRVTEVSENESRVLLLLDPTCSVWAVLADSREPGMVGGSARAFTRRPILEMTYVARAADVAPGETVVTSNDGPVFPAGLPIGTVLDGGPDEETGLYQRLQLDPVVDFRRLEEVMVILETE